MAGPALCVFSSVLHLKGGTESPTQTSTAWNKCSIPLYMSCFNVSMAGDVLHAFYSHLESKKGPSHPRWTPAKPTAFQQQLCSNPTSLTKGLKMNTPLRKSWKLKSRASERPWMIWPLSRQTWNRKWREWERNSSSWRSAMSRWDCPGHLGTSSAPNFTIQGDPIVTEEATTWVPVPVSLIQNHRNTEYFLISLLSS